MSMTMSVHIPGLWIRLFWSDPDPVFTKSADSIRDYFFLDDRIQIG